MRGKSKGNLGVTVMTDTGSAQPENQSNITAK